MVNVDDNSIAGESVIYFMNDNNGAQEGPLQFMVDIKDIDGAYYVKVVCNENSYSLAFGASGGQDLNRPSLMMSILYTGE